MNSDIPAGRSRGLYGLRTGKKTGRIITLVLAALLSVWAGYLGYNRFFAPAGPAAPPQTATARSGSLVSTVTATGSVIATRQAKLAFATTGKLAEMSASIGMVVKAGDVLAKQDQASLLAKVAQAESSLRLARLRLSQLNDGSTPEEIAAAETAYKAAQIKYRDTVAGAKDSDIQAARLAVSQATLALSSAQAALDKLKNPTPSDIATAQATVDQARWSLTTAQVKLDTLKAGPTAADWGTALAAVESARATLDTAQTKVDQVKAGNSQGVLDIQNQELAVQNAAASLLRAKDQLEAWKNGDHSGGTSNSQMEQAVVNAQASYDYQVTKLAQMRANAPQELTSALNSLSSAQAGYNAAVAKVNTMKAGPTQADLVPAQAAVENARASLASAETKLEQLKNPTASDIADAQAKVDSASANLLAAQVKLDDLLAGPKEVDVVSADSSLASAKANLVAKTNPPKATDLATAEDAVAQADANLKSAQADLAGSVIAAPFDGVVSAIAGNVGEQVSAAVVTLVDPKAIRIDVTVDETDVGKLRAGQTAAVTFDAQPDVRLAGKVIAVAPAGTTTQGVVSYLVSLGVESPNRTLPAGMSASAAIETQRLDNVLLVPNRAVRTQGRNRVVDVMVGDKTETRTVQVGASNDQSTQITSGLKEGDVVVIPSTTIRSTMNTGGGPGGSQPVMKVQTR